MGVNSSKGFNFRLMASGSNGFTELDLFKDEIITVSDNVTGLFDIGVLPSDFTRQILVPGTKKNNAFFEHVYDIAVENPYLFETNVKVPAYFDFDGLYVSQGYLQLNKVNVYANRFVDSYEISIYGTLSSFARDINRLYLTDLTSSLAQYNHTSSIQNITSSWEGNLFNGDIVYPLAEYGQKIQYTPEETQFGIDSISGSLCVQDFKPAIRIKPVWDAIFETAGYTYSSSFMNQSFLDGVYMLCNNQLRYPVYDDINLETYGLFKIGPISGSATNLILPSGSTDYQLPWYSIQSNPNGNMSSSLDYTLDFTTKLRGEIKLNFEVTPDDNTSTGYPLFNLVISGSAGNVSTPLVAINNYMEEVYTYNLPFNKTETFNLVNEWSIGSVLPAGKYKFFINYTTTTTGPDPEFVVTLDPSGKPESYLSVTKVNQGGDGKVINIAKNMPYGTNGIKLVDFIKGIQRKYNLVIYPNKTQQKQFIVETFNDWYDGEVKNFDKYINLDEKIEVIPANNLAVNELNFGDTLDTDYVSQQFQKENNREFGKTYYVDTENFFSQGTFEVKTTFASSPIIYLSGTGDSGSVVPTTDNKVSVSDADNGTESITCVGSSYTNDVRVTTVTYVDSTGTPTINYGAPVVVDVRYDIGLCFGGTSTQVVSITIPYGASSATYQYYSTAYVDCGSAPCVTETQTINCVSSVTGQTGIGLYSSSPIIAC